MDWGKAEVSTWEEFLKAVSGFTKVGPVAIPAYIFRGVARHSDPLRPPLLRLVRELGLSESQIVDLERLAIHEFQVHAQQYFSGRSLPADNDDLEWLSLMQHYGAPTRLLDWTASPYVAAYFACIKEPNTPGTIWALHHGSIRKDPPPLDGIGIGREKLGGDILEIAALKNEPQILSFYSDRPTPRQTAQQSYFTVSNRPLCDHRKLILGSLSQKEDTGGPGVLGGQMVIKPSAKLALLRELRMMNVTARTLFPGLDGLGRSVSELVQLETARFRDLSEEA